MPIKPRLGFQGKLYYREAGADGDDNWLELKFIGDVTLSRSDDEVEINTRAGNGEKQFLQGLRDSNVEFTLVWDPDDTGVKALIDAREARKAIGLTILDGPIDEPGSYGVRGDFVLPGFERAEPIGETMTVNVTAKPALSDFVTKVHVVPAASSSSGSGSGSSGSGS